MKHRKAIISDCDAIMALIEQAKIYLKQQGINQWQNEYPNISSIQKDILSGDGYVLTNNTTIVGYACISFNAEISYEHIQGSWQSMESYAVIHRMVIDNKYKGKGLANLIFQYAETLCLQKNIHSIKIDTDDDNSVMKHLLAKNGYVYCGIVQFDNSNKIAFEKLF